MPSKAFAISSTTSRSCCAAAGGAGWHFPLVDVALEGAGAGGAQGELAEAVPAGVALPASGAAADGAGAWLAGG